MIREPRGAVRCAAVLLACGGWLTQRAEGAPPAPGNRPEGIAGPFRVVVDRVAHNRKISVTYRSAGDSRPPTPPQFTRTVHLQLAVFADEKWAGPGLATFQVKGVTAETANRTVDLAHYGGMLETPTDGAVLRAYLYVPNFPLGPTEIRSVEGDIVAYEKSSHVELEIPLDGDKAPAPVVQAGIRATVREWELEGDSAQAVIWVEAPANTVLINTSTDGTYGVSLVNAAGRSANTLGGALLQPRVNQAELRVGFQNLRGAPAKLKLRFLHRAGARKTYPFRIQNIPTPSRSAPAPLTPPAPKGD